MKKFLIILFLLSILLVGASIVNYVMPGTLTQFNATITDDNSYNDTYLLNLSGYVTISSATFNFTGYNNSSSYLKNFNISINGTNILKIIGELNENNISLDAFNDSSTQTNLTFTGNENQTVYLDILKNANVSYGVFNLEGFPSDSVIEKSEFNGTGTDSPSCPYCYATGDFSSQNSLTYFGDCGTMKESGDYMTFDETLNYTDKTDFTIDFKLDKSTIVTGAMNILLSNDSSTWKTCGSISGNFIDCSTISISCHPNITGSKLYIRFIVSTTYDAFIYGVKYKVLTTVYPTNPFIEINNTQVWNYSGEFTTTAITNNFNSTINDYLLGCSQDSDNYCNISILSHSDTIGKLKISPQINYTINKTTKDFSSTLNSYLSQCILIDSLWCEIYLNLSSEKAGILQIDSINLPYLPTMSTPTITPDPISETEMAFANSTYYGQPGDTANLYVNWTVDDVLVHQDNLDGQSPGTTMESNLSSTNYSIGNTIAVYFWADDGLNGTVVSDSILINHPPVIEYNATNKTFPRYGDVIIIQANISDYENHTISWCNFTINSSNGTAVVDNVNGSYEGNFNDITEWNSSSYTIDTYGIWYWDFVCWDGYSTTSEQGTFDTEIPEINVTAPARDYGRNWSLPLNYSIGDLGTLVNCGYYVINRTDNSQVIDNGNDLTCGTDQSTTINISSYGNLTLIVNATDSYNNTNSSNISFYLEEDNTNPSVTITQPTGTITSFLSIPLQVNVSDTYLDSSSCVYRIESRVGAEVKANTSMSCNINTNFDLADYGARTIIVYALDDANNLATKEQNFTLSAPPVTPPSALGGTPAPTTIIVGEENIEFTVLSESRSGSYTIFITKGDERRKEIRIENAKNELKDLKLECLSKRTCPWITLEDTLVTVPAKTNKIYYFTIKVPEVPDDEEDHEFQIRATYTDSGGAKHEAYLNGVIKISFLGNFLKDLTIVKATAERGAFTIKVYALLSFIFSFLLILSSALLLKLNPPKGKKASTIFLDLGVSFGIAVIITVIVGLLVI